MSTRTTLMGKVMSYFLFLFVLFLSLERSGSSSVCGARSSSRYLIIILSEARARLIDVPLNCLQQADDLTKALASAWPLCFLLLLKQDDFICCLRWLHFMGAAGGKSELCSWCSGLCVFKVFACVWGLKCKLRKHMYECVFLFNLCYLRADCVQLVSYCAAFISKHTTAHM